MKKILEVSALDNYPPEIGVWLWAMEEARANTKSSITGLEQNIIDWAGPDGKENSIGSLLYHIAEIEMAWLYFDILLQRKQYPKNLFPIEPFTDGHLTHIENISLKEHIERLDSSRTIFLEALKNITIADWSVLRSPEGDDYSVSPAWAVFHLVEHEAGHNGQIAIMKARATDFFKQTK